MTVAETRDKWRKSSYSAQTDSCVEVSIGAPVGVRDTKDRTGGELALGASSWSAFLAGLKK